MSANWEDVNPTIQLWALQLHHHFDSEIPDKEHIVRSILLSDPSVGNEFANSMYRQRRISSGKFKLEISPLTASKIHSINKLIVSTF